MRISHVNCPGGAPDAIRLLEDAVAGAPNPKARGAMVLQLEVGRAFYAWVDNAKGSAPGCRNQQDLNCYIIECTAAAAAAMLAIVATSCITPGQEVAAAPFILERVREMVTQAIGTAVENRR